MHDHLTPIGKTLVSLRVERQETIAHMAMKLGRKPRHLSGLEHGRDALPDGFIDRLIYEYGLPAEHGLLIAQAADRFSEFEQNNFHFDRRVMGQTTRPTQLEFDFMG